MGTEIQRCYACGDGQDARRMAKKIQEVLGRFTLFGGATEQDKDAALGDIAEIIQGYT